MPASFDIIPFDDARGWEDALAPFGGGDVYYQRGYLGALRTRGEGEPFLIASRSGDPAACHVTLRRPVPDELLAADDGRPFDLISPYGYSGPLLRPNEPHAAQWFAEVWDEAAHELHAVSEFVRFHPLLRTHYPFVEASFVGKVSETVWIDLQGEIRSGLAPVCARNLRTAEKKGVTVEFGGPESVARFGRLYADTMDRRGARDYYRFEDAYFRALAEGLGEDVWIATAVHENRDTAAAMLLRHGQRIHYHLGGSTLESRPLCATNLLLVAAAERAQSLDLTAFHLGGGMAPGDRLFEFKAGFSPLRAEFWVGRRIYDAANYKRLSLAREGLGHVRGSFFPAYRAPMEVAP